MVNHLILLPEAENTTFHWLQNYIPVAAGSIKQQAAVKYTVVNNAHLRHISQHHLNIENFLQPNTLDCTAI